MCDLRSLILSFNLISVDYSLVYGSCKQLHTCAERANILRENFLSSYSNRRQQVAYNCPVIAVRFFESM